MLKRCNKNQSILTSCTASSSCQCNECKPVISSACQCPECNPCSISATTCSSTSCSTSSCSTTSCATTACTTNGCSSSTACTPICSSSSCSNNSTCTPVCSSTCSTTSSCSTSSCTTTSSESSDCSSSSTCSSSSSECCSVSSTDGSTCSSSEEILGRKKFDITFGCKEGHLYADHIVGNKAIHVNCKVAPILKLRRGYIYYFNVKQKACNGNYDNAFVLTQNPIGKIGCVEPVPLCDSFDPVTHGCVKYHVTCKTPKYFYYQNANAAHQGGLILVESD